MLATDALFYGTLLFGVAMVLLIVVALCVSADKGDHYAARALREDREVADLDRLWDLS